MNKRILSLALACAFVCAHAQEPPGCNAKTHTRKQLHQHSEISGKLPRRKVLDLRRHKKNAPAHKTDIAYSRMTPVFASPIYLPQESGRSAAITASNGFLYVVVGEKLYKVNEKTLKTIQVSQLGRPGLEPVGDSSTPKRTKRKIVASAEEDRRPHTTARHHGSKTD